MCSHEAVRQGQRGVRCAGDRLADWTGFFASARARSDRAMAEGAAGAIAPSSEPIAAAEARAAQTYWDSVEAQCKANAVPIPKLSQRAEAAVAALAVVPDDKARAALWRSATAVMALGPELRRFSDAVQQRLGEETVLAAVSRTLHILKEAERADAHEVVIERLA